MVYIDTYLIDYENDLRSTESNIYNFINCFGEVSSMVGRGAIISSEALIDISIILPRCINYLSSSAETLYNIQYKGYFKYIERYYPRLAIATRIVIDDAVPLMYGVIAIVEIILAAARLRLRLMEEASREIIDKLFHDIASKLRNNNIMISSTSDILKPDNIKKIHNYIAAIIDSIMDTLGKLKKHTVTSKIDLYKEGIRNLP